MPFVCFCSIPGFEQKVTKQTKSMCVISLVAAERRWVFGVQMTYDRSLVVRVMATGRGWILCAE